jgi:hypothetical protein
VISEAEEAKSDQTWEEGFRDAEKAILEFLEFKARQMAVARSLQATYGAKALKDAVEAWKAGGE